MEKIENILLKSKIIRTLQFKQKWLNNGFTQVSNRLLRDISVSIGARLLYILLMSRCFRKQFSYPGRDILMKELGIKSTKTFTLYKDELVNNDWILVKRRGQGKTNIYFLLKH